MILNSHCFIHYKIYITSISLVNFFPPNLFETYKHTILFFLAEIQNVVYLQRILRMYEETDHKTHLCRQLIEKPQFLKGRSGESL